MKIKIELELHESSFEPAMLTGNSLERVLNTAHRLIESYADEDEDYTINLEDLEYLLPLASRLWFAAANAVRDHYQEEAK